MEKQQRTSNLLLKLLQTTIIIYAKEVIKKLRPTKKSTLYTTALTKTKSKRQELKNTHYNIMRSINNTDDDLNIIQQNITTSEVIEMIKKLKLKTAPGEDRISMEAFKYAGQEVMAAITNLCQRMWSEGMISKDLQKSLIIPLYKKGDKTQTVNYRPITLLNCIFKIYEKVLENRLRSYTEEHDSIKFCQKGSMKGSGTVEAIFALNSAILQNNTKPITLAFLDLSKAYDRVWRTGLWTKIWQMGVRGKLFRAIHSTYTNATFQYMIGKSKSSTHQTNQGIRQGSVLSPLLFIMLYTDIVHDSSRNSGIPLKTNTGTESMMNQCFVDDTVLITGEPSQIISQIDGYNAQAAAWGTILNLHKTKIISNRNIDPIKLWMEKNKIDHEGSRSHLYLGVWISLHNNTWNTHYKNVIKKAKKTLYHLKSKGLDRWCMPMEKTIKVLQKLVFTKLTYAAEVIIPSDAVIKKVDNFISEAIKSTTHIPWETPNEDTLWEAGMSDFTTLLQQAKFRFHHKMTSPKYSNNKSQQYYTKGNYLYDHIAPQISLAFGDMNSEQYKEKINKSKWSWKKEINIATTTNQLSRIKDRLCATMKPSPGCWSMIQLVPEIHQHTYIKARLNAWGKSKLTCECGNTMITPTVHIFFECENEHIKVQRTTLRILIELLASEKIKTATKMTQMLWLLGKPYNNDKENNLPIQLLVKTAEFVFNAAQLLTEQIIP